MNKWLNLFGAGIVSATACQQADQPVRKPTEEHSDNIAAGKLLFSSYCASCHKVNAEMSGPALYGVEQRWSNRSALQNFIRNSQLVIDTYAKQLFLQSNQTIMPAMPQLSVGDFSCVLTS